MNDLITVIVPVYKAADFIEKCAESLLAQTYKNIEYFFVNDCSPDNSMFLLQSVIDKYPERKEKINIINFEHNQGHANARNAALKNCSGKYVIQIDSDDYVDITMLEKMHSCIETNNAEICCCDYYKVTNNGLEYGHIPEDMTNKESIVKCKYSLSYSAHWNKLIKTSLIKDNNIYCVPNVNNWVDIGQTLPLRIIADKIVLLHEPLYYYNTINQNSVSINFTENRAKHMLVIAKYLHDFLLEHGEQYQIMANFLLFIPKDYWIINGKFEFDKWRHIYPDAHKYVFKCPFPFKKKIMYILVIYHCGWIYKIMWHVAKIFKK